MSEEIWKDIPGYEGYYQASNKGRIKSLDRTICDGRYRKGKQLSECADTDGYLTVVLSKNSHAKTYRVHKLIAITFIDNPNKYKQINHKDENKHNNTVENLEWCTNVYNLHYGTRTIKAAISRSGSKSHLSKLSEEEVREIRMRYKKRSRDANSIVLSKEYDVHPEEIRRIASYKRWKYID